MPCVFSKSASGSVSIASTCAISRRIKVRTFSESTLLRLLYDCTSRANLYNRLSCSKSSIFISVFVFPHWAKMYNILSRNLIDGIDGLASGISVIALIAYLLLFSILGVVSYTIFAAALIGAVVVFMYYNLFGDIKKGTKQPNLGPNHGPGQAEWHPAQWQMKARPGLLVAPALAQAPASPVALGTRGYSVEPQFLQMHHERLTGGSPGALIALGH